MLPNHEFDSKLEELNEIIRDDTRLKEMTDKYYSHSNKQVGSFFEPINSFVRKLQLIGFFPSLLQKKQKLCIKNYINCESHRDKVLWWTQQDIL